MTLILKLELDMVKIYYHTKNEVSMSTHSSYSLNRQSDRQTHRHEENITSSTYAGGKNAISVATATGVLDICALGRLHSLDLMYWRFAKNSLLRASPKIL